MSTFSNAGTKLVEIFNKMHQDTDFTDCTIIVDSIKFECHKIVLATDSEFFRRMFLSNFKESSSREIHLKDVTPVVFLIFREYMYKYDSKVLNNYDLPTLMNLFECGNMWMAPSIVKDCATILVTRAQGLTTADLPIFFELGHKHNNSILINGITAILQSQNVVPFNGNSSFLLNYDIFQKFISFYRNGNADALTENYLAFNRRLKRKHETEKNANGSLNEIINEKLNQEKSKK
ncbi:kelch-like protein 15 [Drosophila innubila]|uniref:kelch-like protein 15 n=1 Tax=Drosophila innubila TaxID=198719 RepID=UPI00148E5973|nr:kelch-like protein 15 [Drosophila innubila]